MRWRTLNRGWLLLLSVACAAGAVWLERLTVPLRAEASDPLPTGYGWQAYACPDDASSPPRGVGPDPLVEAPLVTVRRGEIYLDGLIANSADGNVGDLLTRKRVLWRSFHPLRAFPGGVVLALPPVTDLETFASLLSAAHEAGYDDVYLLLEERVESERALMGTICGRRVTGVRLRARCPDDSVGLSISDYGDYGALVEQLRLKRKLGVMPCIAETGPRPESL